MKVWTEIIADHEDENGVLSVDGYATPDENESGNVIAYIVKGTLYPVDHRIFECSTAKTFFSELNLIGYP